MIQQRRTIKRAKIRSKSVLKQSRRSKKRKRRISKKVRKTQRRKTKRRKTKRNTLRGGIDYDELIAKAKTDAQRDSYIKMKDKAIRRAVAEWHGTGSGRATGLVDPPIYYRIENKATVRKGPGKGHQKLGKFPEGTVITLVAWETDGKTIFYKTSTTCKGIGDGWLKRETSKGKILIKPLGKGGNPHMVPVRGGWRLESGAVVKQYDRPVRYLVKRKVTVRKTPDPNGESIGEFAEGTVIEVMGERTLPGAGDMMFRTVTPCNQGMGLLGGWVKGYSARLGRRLEKLAEPEPEPEPEPEKDVSTSYHTLLGDETPPTAALSPQQAASRRMALAKVLRKKEEEGRESLDTDVAQEVAKRVAGNISAEKAAELKEIEDHKRNLHALLNGRTVTISDHPDPLYNGVYTHVKEDELAGLVGRNLWGAGWPLLINNNKIACIADSSRWSLYDSGREGGRLTYCVISWSGEAYRPPPVGTHTWNIRNRWVEGPAEHQTHLKMEIKNNG